MITPAIVRITPAIGSNGIKGQRIINTKQAMPPMIMISVPARSNINLEIKPIKRDTSLSINM